jgi:hypothetical protein
MIFQGMHGVALLAMLLVSAAIAQTSQGRSSEDGSNAVKYYSKDDLAASFAEGGTLLTETNYKVMTARRTESGNVEVHRMFTDIFYIVQGSTNIVTGGKVIGEKDANPDEPGGTRLRAVRRCISRPAMP